MRLKYYLPLFILLFAFAQESWAQDEDQPVRRGRTRGTEAVESNSGLLDLTERARIKNEEASQGARHIAWLREIYRTVNLEQDNNAALYYPIQPIGDRKNLFTLLFQLMADGKITAYKYLDGREIFTDAYKFSFKEDLLDKYGILYQAQGAGDNTRYTVDEIDIPSSEVLSYMIKEAFFFDQATGTYQSQVIAICPMLVRVDYYYGTTTSDPLFWIPYEEIRPFLSRELIMTSNYNNALTYTMDDYFTKRMYTGEIIKTTNLMNESLAQQVAREQEQRQLALQKAQAAAAPEMSTDVEESSSDELVESEMMAQMAPIEEVDYLKLAQDSIERDLRLFRDGLWVYNDSIAKQMEADSGKKSKKSSETKAKKSSSSSSGSSSSSSSPTKSVRRGNR